MHTPALPQGLGYIGLMAGGAVGVLVLAKTGLLLKFIRLVMDALSCGGQGPKTKPVEPTAPVSAAGGSGPGGGDAGAATPIARPSLTASAMPWTIPAAPAAGVVPPSARSPLESAASRLEYLRALDTSLESARLAYWAQYGIPAAPPPVPAPGAVPYPYTQGPPSQRASVPGMHSIPGSARVEPLHSPLHSGRELAMAPPPP